MKAIVLLSGGIDSAVCLAQAAREGRNVVALHFQYGATHSSEGVAATMLATRYKVPLEVVNLPLRLGASKLSVNPSGLQRGGVSPYFVPGRNLAFIALADNIAEVLGSNEIWVGFNADDYAGFPDCRREFIDSLQPHLHARLRAPLLGQRKAEVVATARRLGVPIAITSSCYAGTACGECDACVLRDEALR